LNSRSGGNGMRAFWVIMGLLAAAFGACAAQAAAQPGDAGAAAGNPGRLVREVVYNELHEHADHGYFHYWIERNMPGGTSLEEQVETAAGPVTRMLQSNGLPLAGHAAALEQERLNELRDSPSKQASRRAAYRQDEERVTKVLVLLPDAFVFRDEGIEDGVQRLQFTPNPSYAAHGVETRVLHSMSGELWVDLRTKRLRRLQGHLDENVSFGFGLLGRVDKGSWFRMVRTQVSPSDWKMEQFELHLSGRALLFKTLARNTSEKRGGFAAVPPRITLEQGVRMLEDSAFVRTAIASDVAPASLVTKR